jgi:putative addiction module killer protein
LRIHILKSPEFREWYSLLPPKTKAILDARLDRICWDGHFGVFKIFEGLVELKWGSGMRVYGCFLGEKFVVLLGGNKNGQNKDIRQAKKIREAFFRSP